MKKYKIRMLALLMLVIMSLTACGEPLYVMTAEEEELIVQYAAYTISKHNVFQKDGRVEVRAELWEEQEETQEDTQQEEQEDTQQEEQKNKNTDTQANTPAVEEISLAEAIGYKGQVKVSYKGFLATENYQEGKVFSLNAKSGYTFVVTQFTMKNISGKKLDMNVLEHAPSFRASFDGQKEVQEDVTLLLKDLSTYEGTLETDESIDVVLLFEVPTEQADTIKDISLSVKTDNTVKAVQL